MAAKSFRRNDPESLRRLNQQLDAQIRRLHQESTGTSRRGTSILADDLSDSGTEHGDAGTLAEVPDSFQEQESHADADDGIDPVSDYEANVQTLRAEAQREADAVCGTVRVDKEVTNSGRGGEREVIQFKTIVIHVRAAVKLVLRAGAEPFCDAFGILRLRRPQGLADEAAAPLSAMIPCREKQGDRGAWPIRSRQTLAWIANLCHEQAQRPLTHRELDQVLLILEGKALENVRDAELDDVIEREPLLALLIALSEKHAEWRGTATELLAALGRLAERQGVGIELDERWPKTAAHLTLELRNLQVWLHQAGIQYEFNRRKHERVHVLVAAGGPSSPSNPLRINELREGDAAASPVVTLGVTHIPEGAQGLTSG